LVPHNFSMRISDPSWELAALVGLACFGLGFAGAQNDAILATVFAAEAGLAFIETLYLPA
jgi:hypothetical protein